ncbi:MAG: hypothetical protein ACOCV1_02555 [Bacillota bacterium]
MSDFEIREYEIETSKFWQISYACHKIVIERKYFKNGNPKGKPFLTFKLNGNEFLDPDEVKKISEIMSVSSFTLKRMIEDKHVSAKYSSESSEEFSRYIPVSDSPDSNDNEEDE